MARVMTCNSGSLAQGTHGIDCCDECPASLLPADTTQTCFDGITWRIVDWSTSDFEILIFGWDEGGRGGREVNTPYVAYW